MPRFDHAYTFGFSVISDTEDASDVTADMLMASALTRLASLVGAQGLASGGREDMLDACDAPFDTFEVEEPVTLSPRD